MAISCYATVVSKKKKKKKREERDKQAKYNKSNDYVELFQELAFYIDKKGKRVRNDWSIVWEGNPTAFTFKFPYVVAFNSNFIEVRHMDTVR
jgi:hypothetical protein